MSGTPWTRAGRAVGVAVGACLLAWGCGAEGPADGNGAAATSASAGEEAAPAGTRAGATTASGGTSTVSAPPGAGYGFGRPATAAEIAAWDIDVGPDGEGLPPGGGTVEEGAEVYRTQCQACHGATGVEGPNGVLVSPEPLADFAFGSSPGMRSTIGNYWPYATTVFDYVRRSMPFDRPGSLTDDEVYAVTAWLLWMNGLIAEDAVIDAESLPAVQMPAREHFVPSEDVQLDALP